MRREPKAIVRSLAFTVRDDREPLRVLNREVRRPDSCFSEITPAECSTA